MKEINKYLSFPAERNNIQNRQIFPKVVREILIRSNYNISGYFNGYHSEMPMIIKRIADRSVHYIFYIIASLLLEVDVNV